MYLWSRVHAVANLLQCPLCQQDQPQSLAGCRPSRTIWVSEYVILPATRLLPLTPSGSQVQPFHLVTPDNETLYGWHLMPLHLCREHEQDLIDNPPNGPAKDYTQTVAYKSLANDPNARVVVSCK